MDKKPMECGSMNMMMGQGNSEVILCDPLEKLKKEHAGLRKRMAEFSALADTVGDGLSEDDESKLSRLKQLVSDFSNELEIHSLKEDDALFPMMARYIGREVGPVAVMEYEHEQARKHLSDFAESVKSAPSKVNREEAKEVASHAIQAYSLLTMHFTKEDNILFPMADKMLTADEKAQLNQRVSQP